MIEKIRHEREGVLGVQISALNLEQAESIIAKWLAQRTKHYVCITTVHGIMECQQDPQLMEIYNASGIATADGMPLVWILRSRGHTNMTVVHSFVIKVDLATDLFLPRAICFLLASQEAQSLFDGDLGLLFELDQDFALGRIF